MKIIHVIRDTVDWGALTLENYFDQPFDNDFVKNTMVEMIRKWDAVLDPSYFKFRDMITKIALNNHDRLDVDIRIKSSRNLEKELKKIPKPYVVLFVDDDDWHNPAVVDMLRDECSDTDLDGIIWDHYAFLTNYKSFNWAKNDPYFLKANRGFFHTNNYALTDRFWDKLSTEDIDYLYNGVKYDLCYGHNMIDRRFKDKINYKEMRGPMLRELPNIVSACQGKIIDVPQEISWANEEIKEMMELYKKLTIKKTMQ
jgi:hypothetical protein